MKRALAAVFGTCLIIVSIFGAASCYVGFRDSLDIADYKTTEREDGLADIELLRDGISQLSENQAAYAEGVAAYEQGLIDYKNGQAELEAGTLAVEEGKAQLASGYAQYYAGKQTYNDSLATYNAGVQTIEDNTQAYNDGKEQLSSAKPIYSLVKPISEAYANSGLDLPITGALVGIIDEKVISAYEDGQDQINQYENGVAELEAGSVALADGKAQLDSAAYQLGQGKQSVSEGEQQLAEGQAALDAAAIQLEEGAEQLAVYEDGEKQIADGLDTLYSIEPVYSQDGDEIRVPDVASRLDDDFTYLELDASGESVVMNGVEYLDLDASLELCQAGVDFIEEQTTDVKAEVIHRIVLYVIAGIACILGLAAGVASFVGLMRRDSKRTGMVPGCIAALLAVCANVYGIFTRYAGYTYPLENGTYVGRTQMIAVILLAIAAVLFAASAFVIKTGETAGEYAASGSETFVSGKA